MGLWSKNQAEIIVLPWIKKYGGTDFYVLFCLAALIFRHQQTFFLRGFVFPDRLNTLQVNRRQKSLRSAGLRSWFPMRPSSMFQEERPWIADISANPDRFLARIRVSGPPEYTWWTARAEIAQPRRPKRPILNLGLLCCWRGASISVDILASHFPFARGFVSMHEKFVFDTMHGKLDRFLEN